MKIKTHELSDIALDWVVAKCKGYINDAGRQTYDALLLDINKETFVPSEDWEYGGPIIEREKISIAYEPSMIYDDTCRWKALSAMSDNGHYYDYYGPTPLIAAMRCYVASKLGDEVEVPDDLT